VFFRFIFVGKEEEAILGVVEELEATSPSSNTVVSAIAVPLAQTQASSDMPMVVHGAIDSSMSTPSFTSPTISSAPKTYIRLTSARTSEGSEFWWPTTVKSGIAWSAVVFIAHGCKQKQAAPSWWDMPIEREVLLYLHERRFLPVTSLPYATCWTDKDEALVLLIEQYVFRELNLTDNVPLFAIGLTNGGKFIEKMASKMQTQPALSAFALMNAGIWRDVAKLRYPPVLFVAMARNSELCVQNQATVAALQSQGLRAEFLVAEPRPLSNDFFWKLGQVLSLDESERYYSALLAGKFLWPGSSILLDDALFGRDAGPIKNLTRHVLPRLASSIDASFKTTDLAQLLSIAWGGYGATEEFCREIVDFFLNAATKNL